MGSKGIAYEGISAPSEGIPTLAGNISLIIFVLNPSAEGVCAEVKHVSSAVGPMRLPSTSVHPSSFLNVSDTSAISARQVSELLLAITISLRAFNLGRKCDFTERCFTGTASVPRLLTPSLSPCLRFLGCRSSRGSSRVLGQPGGVTVGILSGSVSVSTSFNVITNHCQN